MDIDNITKYTCQVKEVKAAFLGERGGWNPMMKQILQLLLVMHQSLSDIDSDVFY